MAEHLSEFVTAVLEAEGAVTEPLAGGAVLALLPGELAARLHLPEEFRFREQASASPDGELIAYGTDTLARIAEAACGRGRTAHAVFPVDYLKKGSLEAMAGEVFQVSRASRTFLGAAEAVASYLVVHIHYRVRSVETREGVISLVLNECSGARVDELAQRVELSELADAGAEEDVEDRMQIPVLLERIKALVKVHVEEAIGPFRASMQKRLERDWRRVNDYYAQMKTETRKRLRGSHKEETRARLAEKLAAINADLEAKRRDIVARYAVSAEMEVASALRLYVLALKVSWRVALRGAQRVVSTFWNPFTKTVEPLFCEACSQTAGAFVFCDKLHRACAACSGTCSTCGRRICKVCTPGGCAACAGT